ncbi:hypothetical protein Q6264_28700, partial [Klebsiella pneumoniae]|uniref:hypothetical protein n=1 Tax=Klebsiella pneumoniae TaxID=573 RepID=UPI00273008D7
VNVMCCPLSVARGRLQFTGPMGRCVIVNHIQRLGDLAFDGFGGLQPQHETFGFTACTVKFFVGGGAGDCVKELGGVRAYAFGQRLSSPGP